MPHFSASLITHILDTYGYLAVLIFVAIESTGIPFPGETMLITAALYAGATHHLAIGFVVAAAAAGAILGDNVGYWVGREGGYRLLRRYGKYIRVEERRLKLGRYLFQRHGGKVVFFGRFVAVLRAWAAFLAGTNHMSWPAFLVANAAGGILWACLYGFGAYLFGHAFSRVEGPLKWVLLAIGVPAIILSIMLVRRNEERLQQQADRAFPGPLEPEPAS